MKSFSASLAAILLAAAAPVCLQAEEPATGFGLTPAKPDSSLLPAGQPGLPLIPDALPTPDKAPKAAEEKQSKTSAAEDALRDMIKLRVAKTKAQSEPDLQALWDTTAKARTDYEQREIMTKYYNQLCDRIAKFDKTLKPDVIESLRGKYLGSYNQSRIAPTVPPVPKTTATR